MMRVSSVLHFLLDMCGIKYEVTVKVVLHDHLWLLQDYRGGLSYDLGP